MLYLTVYEMKCFDETKQFHRYFICITKKAPERSRTSRVPIMYSPFVQKSLCHDVCVCQSFIAKGHYHLHSTPRDSIHFEFQRISTQF